MPASSWGRGQGEGAEPRSILPSHPTLSPKTIAPKQCAVDKLDGDCFGGEGTCCLT